MIDGIVRLNYTDLAEICKTNQASTYMDIAIIAALTILFLIFYICFFVQYDKNKHQEKYLRETKQLDKYANWKYNRKQY